MHTFIQHILSQFQFYFSELDETGRFLSGFRPIVLKVLTFIFAKYDLINPYLIFRLDGVLIFSQEPVN